MKNVTHVLAAEECPVVVLDLDATLFDVGPRVWHILREYADQHEDRDLKKALKSYDKTNMPYLIKDILAQMNMANEDRIENLVPYWFDRFFTDHYQHYDTPIEGAEASKCILCHSAETSLLQRQPTAFHADIKSCQECHIEHQGRAQLPKKMNHDALAKIGLEELEYSEARNESVVQVSRIINWMNHDPQIKAFLKNQHITSREAVLDCMSCHKNDDRHFELFGNDCMQCHGTASWKIARFVHPSPSSRECAQCHQAPPSHYMGHFNMISRPVSGKMQARIDQCYLCHQTTSWPDIKDIGWYKHH